MKKIYHKFNLAICSMVLFIGCEVDNEDLTTQIEENGIEQNESGIVDSEEFSIDPEDKKTYLSYLKTAGFNTEEVIFLKAELIVDGDMVLPYANITESIKGSGKNIAGKRIGTRPNNSIFNRPVQYFIEPAIVNGAAPLNQWDDAIIEAAQRWADVQGTDIRFTRTFNRASANITFTTTRRGPRVLADATSPTTSRVGNRIRINLDELNINRRQEVRIATMMHEIGHTVGFRHSDLRNNNGYNGRLVNCTRDFEDASIMRSIVQRRGVFTFEDQLAITTLFRSTNPIITGFRGQVNTTPRSRSFRIDWNRNRVAGSTVRIRFLQNLQNSVRNIPRQSPIITTANDGSHTMFFRDLTGVIGTNERRRIDYSCMQIEFLSGNTVIDRTQAFSITGSFSNPSDNPRDGDIADPDGNIF